MIQALIIFSYMVLVIVGFSFAVYLTNYEYSWLLAPVACLTVLFTLDYVDQIAEGLCNMIITRREEKLRHGKEPQG